MQDFKVLILGSDANAYYMARCCYEAYQKKAHLIARDRLSFTKFSNILTIEYHEQLWNEKSFVNIVNQYANKYHDNKIVMFSTNETYSMFIARNKDKLAPNLLYFDQDASILETLTNKEKFYKTYKRSSLSFPDTYFYNVSKDSLVPTMEYPMILKPANVVEYNHLAFEGKHKIYKIESETELVATINLIKKAGYKDYLILQEFIEGDDSYLFDSVVYVDRSGKVKVISFAQIGLQEHSKSMVGNAAILINGFNSFEGNVEDMKHSIVSFMERLKMNGFYEFDLKYDKKSNTFKVLEINARQGRSSYYLTPLGANLVETAVDDLLFHKKLVLKDLKEEYLLSFVPKSIVKNFVLNDEFKQKALQLWNTKRVSPMQCPKDKNIKRFLMMKKRLWHYKAEYQNGYWRM